MARRIFFHDIRIVLVFVFSSTCYGICKLAATAGGGAFHAFTVACFLMRVAFTNISRSSTKEVLLFECRRAMLSVFVASVFFGVPCIVVVVVVDPSVYWANFSMC